jgi:cyclopropane-fatty-acyl-phospholipid synthase
MTQSSLENKPVSRGPGTWIMSRLLDFIGTRMVGTPERGALTVVFPDGHSRTVGTPGTGFHPTLTLNNFKVLGEAMHRGTVGFAASYINGDFDVDDLTAVFRFFLENFKSLQVAGHGMFRSAAQDLAYHLSRANTKKGAKDNISEHYDLGNDFYEQWLDPSMTYSCAIFNSDDMTLEQAQREKYRHIADAAGIKEGDEILEIGCGWGGFAEVAARDYNANVRGITLSREQLKYALDRMEKKGLGNRATLVFEDYRDTEGTFDHVCSIEMIEAVGEENWPVYFSTVHDRLKPGGTAAIQAITINEEAFKSYRENPDFIQRFIFPGGMLLTKQAMREQAERVGMVIEKIENFGKSYAETLRQWRDRFLESWPAIAPLGYSEEFKRKWLYYLSYCEAGFDHGQIDVGIYQYKKAAKTS